MRHLSTLALAGLFGGLLLVGDASACHKHKSTSACPAPAPVCAPAPAPVCAPAPAPTTCAAPKAKHHFKMPKISLHHKKAATGCETTYAPINYSAPATYTTPQSYPSAQSTGQGM